MSAPRSDTPAPAGGRAAIVFTPYQNFVVFLLAFLQFTVVLDFMVLSPLGAFLLRDMGLSTAQFGRVVSAYAFSAGISGLLAAGFADKFDRRKLLLFFYVGFVTGTFLCGIANTYTTLLLARMVTGVFGGVIGSIAFAIITDLFPFEARGRVMGTVQSAFAASQVLGLPIGLKLATTWGWHSSFIMIAGVSALAGVLIAMKLRPITAHLELKSNRDPVAHLIHTAKQPRYIVGYTATMLLATGGFMLMPFGTTFSVRNMLIPASSLWIVYMITGLVSMVGGPLIGRWSDVWGKYRTFVVGTVLAIGIVIYYTHLGPTGLVVMTLLSCLLFLCISARMISASALTSGVPAPPDRGAYMSITASLQQISGGLASALAGVIVKESPNQGPLLRYGVLGLVASVGMVATIPLMFNVHRVVMKSRAEGRGPAPGPGGGAPSGAEAGLVNASPSPES